MRQNRVSKTQALLLHKFGFKEHTNAYYWLNRLYEQAYYGNWNVPERQFISAPTVDEAIDWLRRKYNIIIYHTHVPYVCPKTRKIVYTFASKICNPKWGWNHRILLKRGIQSADIYAAKRSAITIALNWILSQKSKKSKNNKKLSKHGIKRKNN